MKKRFFLQKYLQNKEKVVPLQPLMQAKVSIVSK